VGPFAGGRTARVGAAGRERRPRGRLGQNGGLYHLWKKPGHWMQDSPLKDGAVAAVTANPDLLELMPSEFTAMLTAESDAD
jgi:muconolactone delta-isomerase